MNWWYEVMVREHWRLADGRWIHRPPWKVAVNTALRAVQPWSRRWVVYTRCVGDPPRAVGYGFGRVRHVGTRPRMHGLLLLIAAALAWVALR